jgi:hypothetical protein
MQHFLHCSLSSLPHCLPRCRSAAQPGEQSLQ